MGVITISINSKTEELLRKLAIARFNKKKGYLSLAITEALNDWSEKEKNDNISEGLALLEKGVDLGGMISKKREEWHKR